MDLNFLTDLGNKMLEKPKFQKYLGDISKSQLNNELSKLTSELKELDDKIETSPSGIGIEQDETKEDSKLTREERKQNRQNRRKKRKEDREKKKEEIKKKIKIIKQKIIPRFEIYTVSGRIYDAQTAEPLKGVNINVGIDQSQIIGGDPSVGIGIDTPDELSSVLESDVKIAADFKVYAPLGNAAFVGRRPRTDNDGYYSFKFKALVIGEEDINNLGEKRELKSLLDYGLIFSKQGYLPNTTSLITLNDQVKRDISTKGLFNIDVSAEKAKDEINNGIYLAGLAANQLFLSGVEKIIVARKKSVQNVTNLLTTKLIPLLISILLAFGISKITEKNQAKCPSPDQLKDAIKKRNRAVRQINQLFTAVVTNTGLAKIFRILSLSLLNTRLTLDSLPFPTAIGTPPAKDFGGLVASVKYNLIARLQRIDDLLEELEDQNKNLNKQVLISLSFLIAGLVIAKLLLKTGDELIGECAKDKIDNGEITLEELREEIQELNEEEEKSLSPNINGFELSVVELNKEVGSLKPRQAVAKNKDGVILLRGESSFSASDKILIDELVFYIKSNNLKAF